MYESSEMDYIASERKSDEEKRKHQSDTVNIASGFSAAQAAKKETLRAAKTYAKPNEYTGNRTLYDNGAAKRNAKMDAFKSSELFTDPYTGKRLVLTKNEAKELYGEEWTLHLAESDHVIPLEKIFNDTKGNTWNTTEDIRKAANSKDNIKVTSRKFNNAKRSRTNEELVNDNEYLERKGIELTKRGKQQALQDSQEAEKSINRQLRRAGGRNVLKTGHEAGLYGAKQAGITGASMSGIMNIISVIQGEKNVEDAIVDTVKDGGKAAATGYVMSGGLTAISQSLSKSSSKFIQGLVKSNVPGEIITAVIATGNTLKRWGDGEITTQECLLELGETGLNMATMGYSMAVGQALIPIPVVGGAIGALVGSMLTSSYYHNLINKLQTKEFEHQERLRIIAECHEAAEQTKAFRRELEVYLESYFNEYQDCFNDAISAMDFAYQTGDTDGVIASANDITRKLGGQVKYETFDEFINFLDDGSIDIF